MEVWIFNCIVRVWDQGAIFRDITTERLSMELWDPPCLRSGIMKNIEFLIWI